MNDPELIEKIVAAARRPCPTIVPVNHLLCSDGQYRGASGIPYSVKVVTPYVVKCIGYAYQDKDGTTYGTRGESEESMRQAHLDRTKTNDASFRSELEKMPASRFKSQVAYWLKQ